MPIIMISIKLFIWSIKKIFMIQGILLLKEDKRLSSPVSVLYYEYYESQTCCKTGIRTAKRKNSMHGRQKHIPFGKAQSPIYGIMPMELIQ